MDNVKKVINSAYKLFAKHGYERTPVLEIAKNAEVSSGTVIYHFKTKENLLCMLHWQFINTLISMTNKKILRSKNGKESLVTAFEEFFRILKANPNESRVMFMDKPFKIQNCSEFEPGPLADLKRMIRQYINLLKSCLEQGRDDGSLVINDVQESLSSVTSMLIGSAWIVLFADADIDNTKKAVIDCIVNKISSSSFTNV